MSIKVTVGKSFKIPLESNVGSTPLGWCLKRMPEGVVFHYQENVPIGPMNTIQMFSFIARTKVPSENACLEFVLIDFTTLEEKNTFNISIETVEKTTNEAGKDKFIEFEGKPLANSANQAYNPAIDYGVLPDNQFEGACVDMMYYIQPRSAFQGNSACMYRAYDMMPRSAFQGNPACVPAVPYGVLPNNQFEGACVDMMYYIQPRSAFQGNSACMYRAYDMTPRSAFQGNPACVPAVPYCVLPNNQFDSACMNREYDIMPRSAFQGDSVCMNRAYDMIPRSAFQSFASRFNPTMFYGAMPRSEF